MLATFGLGAAGHTTQVCALASHGDALSANVLLQMLVLGDHNGGAAQQDLRRDSYWSGQGGVGMEQQCTGGHDPHALLCEGHSWRRDMVIAGWFCTGEVFCLAWKTGLGVSRAVSGEGVARQCTLPPLAPPASQFALDELHGWFWAVGDAYQYETSSSQ